MAKVHSEKFKFGEKEIVVNYNCDSKGVFSCNLHYVIQEQLGLKGKLIYSKLSDLQQEIREAFKRYLESKTSGELVIVICFAACGEYMKLQNGEYNPKFYPLNGGKYKLNVSMSQVNDAIGLSYRVLYKESVDGRINYYTTQHKDNNFPDSFKKNLAPLDFGFLKDLYTSSGVRSGEVSIPFSEEAYKTLTEITKSFQKVSYGLMEMISSDNIENILVSHNHPALVLDCTEE